MKKKYYEDLKRNWKSVVITEEEERELILEFIKEYAELLTKI